MPVWLDIRSPRTAVAFIAVISFIAYVNALPDNLILDDRVFVDAARYAGTGLAGIGHFFTEDLWAASGVHSNLYRPLLLLSIAFQTWLFGEWLPGYHLVNILLHVLATVLVYRFVRYVLNAGRLDATAAGPAAFLAGVIFGVHPIHTEAVNSVFNGSEILVCIGTVGGILWFLRMIDQRPFRAWLGLWLIYFFVLFCRESGTALPALVVATVWLLRRDPWLVRLRLCLPVVTLAVPLAAYLAMRAQALESSAGTSGQTSVVIEAAPSPGPAGPAPSAPVSEEMAPAETGLAQPVPPESAPTEPAPAAEGIPAPQEDSLARVLRHVRTLVTPNGLKHAAVIWFEAWKIVLWPHPLQIDYDRPTTSPWLAIASQLALLSAAIFACARNRPVLLTGLAFFYLSILPSSQVFGVVSATPGLADRILYLPSAGLSIVLAAGCGFLVRWRGLLAATLPAIAVTIVLIALTWWRNSEWASDTKLFESAYAKLEKKELVLNPLLAALLRENGFRRAAEICDENRVNAREAVSWAIHCGSAYGRIGRVADAELAYLAATGPLESRSYAHMNLAILYLHVGRRAEARAHFESGIAEERTPFLKEYFSGLMLIHLHPENRQLLLEAKAHLERALELQPQHVESRQELESLNSRLGLTNG